MNGPQKLNPGNVSSGAKEQKPNPMKSKEPLAESYEDRRFKQIISSIMNLKFINESSGLHMLDSVKKIKEGSKNPDVDMDSLCNTFSAVECDTDSRARFYINFYSALLNNPSADQRAISLDFFVSLKETLGFIETCTSGHDDLFDSRDVLVSLASSTKFQPYLLNASSEIAYYSSGYGVYLGLRSLESLVSNQRFNYEWIAQQDIPSAIGLFAYEMNEYRMAEKKFDHFDRVCRILSNVSDFNKQILDNILKMDCI